MVDDMLILRNLIFELNISEQPRFIKSRRDFIFVLMGIPKPLTTPWDSTGRSELTVASNSQPMSSKGFIIYEKLAALCWDTDVEPTQLEGLLRGDIDRIGHIDRINLYRRLLMTYDWYTLLALIPPELLREALSAPVIEHLYPASLKDRYLYARSILLKIDFINDVVFHYGDFQEAPFYPRIDHWRNILSNKLCALSRREPKDMADILFMAKRFQFSWPEILGEARQKDLWVEPLEISKIINEFPVDLLQALKWVQPVDLDACATTLKTLHQDIFHGRGNSLCQ